ncbi:MobC family replication-relaxation protein [Acinetobacter ursingii]|uniref:MobC family replication-relaxation protein n=1 Tax=Acinetobacter ursingii TaxID=108980 RepID=UPI0032B35708
MGDSSYFVHDNVEKAKRIEDKQSIILEFLAHETFSTSEILGQVLGLSRTATFKTLKSMENQDLVRLHHIEYELAQRGKQTIWGLTPTGALLATDLDNFQIDFYEAGRIATSTMAHSLAIQRVKVAGLKKGWTDWISSRKLKQIAAKDKKKWLQIPDALATSPDGKTVAFEVEKTIKTPKRYESILSNYAKMFLDETVDQVFYICPENIAKRLEMLFFKFNKITIDGRSYPVHENVLKRIQFLSYDEWKNF